MVDGFLGCPVLFKLSGDASRKSYRGVTAVTAVNYWELLVVQTILLQMTLQPTFNNIPITEMRSTDPEFNLNCIYTKNSPPRCSKARCGSFLLPGQREESQALVGGGQSSLLAVGHLGQDLAGARQGKTNQTAPKCKSLTVFSWECCCSSFANTFWSQLNSRIVTS